MEKATPSRPKRVRKSPPKIETKEEQFTPDEVATPTPMENKYAPKPKVGRPTIGVPNRVETVGLGNLKVTTANGYTDVRSN